jgi:hypothetical protein
MIAAAVGAALLVAAGPVPAAAAPAPIEIAGDATCPTPAAIAAALANLLVPASSEPPPDTQPPVTTVTVTRTESALRLALVDPHAHELAVRELPPGGSCADLAAAAAVVVAAWRADLDPAVEPSIAMPVTAPPPPPNAPTVVTTRAAPPPAPRPRAWAFGLGLLASETGGVTAPGAILTGALGLGAGGLALDGSVSGTTFRAADVGTLSGAASWTRVTMAIGPALRFGRGSVRGDVHLQGLGALLHVRGVGVPNAAADTTPELGGGAGARVEIMSGTSVVWLGLDALAWPGDQRLLIANSGDQGRLPRLELVASVGMGLGRFP